MEKANLLPVSPASVPNSRSLMLFSSLVLCLLCPQVQAGAAGRLLFEPQPLQAAELRPFAYAPLSQTTQLPPPTSGDDFLLYPTQAIRAYVDSIKALRLDQGPNAAELAEQHLELGQLYQRQGEHERALAEFAEAEHVNRINFGLNAPEQFPPIELGIEIHLVRKDYRQAIERQRYLVYLHRSRYGRDAAEVAPELAELGDMYFAAFERGIEGDTTGTIPNPDFDPRMKMKNVDISQLSTPALAFLWLQQAQMHYLDAIGNLVANRDYRNPLLYDLETRFIRTLFLQAHRHNVEKDGTFSLSLGGMQHRNPQRRDMLRIDINNDEQAFFRNGEEAFNRILAYLRSDPAADPKAMADALLQFGDWCLLFDRQDRAREYYAAARVWLESHGFTHAAIAAILNPSVPVPLPTFLAQPNSRAALDASAADVTFNGYIDVALTLDEAGHVDAIKVLDRSDNAGAAVEEHLRKVLLNTPFRPRLTADGEGPRETIKLRYNFARI